MRRVSHDVGRPSNLQHAPPMIRPSGHVLWSNDKAARHPVSRQSRAYSASTRRNITPADERLSHVDRGKDARRDSANFAGLRPVPDGTGPRLFQSAPMGLVKWRPSALCARRYKAAQAVYWRPFNALIKTTPRAWRGLNIPRRGKGVSRQPATSGSVRKNCTANVSIPHVHTHSYWNRVHRRGDILVRNFVERACRHTCYPSATHRGSRR